MASGLQRLQFLYGSPRERRALEVQQLLMERGHHRSVKLPYLLVAAIAKTEGLTVTHDDAGPTGQRGSRGSRASGAR